MDELWRLIDSSIIAGSLVGMGFGLGYGGNNQFQQHSERGGEGT
jgi:hypothetical protein